MQEIVLKTDYDKLKRKFLELINKIEQDKIRAIGEFLEEQVKPIMSIDEFSKLINEEGYSADRLRNYNMVYRKIYKDNLVECTDLDLDKVRIISKIEDKEIQQEFIERAKEIPREQLREEVNTFIDTGIKPNEEVKSQIEINLKYNGAVLKLISEMRQLRTALYQVRKERIFDSFTPFQRKKFNSYLGTIKKEYTDLIKEIDENSKYLLEED